MKKLALAVAAAFALAACSREDEHPDWPDVETLFAIQGTSVVCDGTVDQRGGLADQPSGPPPWTWYSCAWNNVRVGGYPKCYASATFERPNTLSGWTLTFLAGHNNCE
jgi:hypothetical protein